MRARALPLLALRRPARFRRRLTLAAAVGPVVLIALVWVGTALGL